MSHLRSVNWGVLGSECLGCTARKLTISSCLVRNSRLTDHRCGLNGTTDTGRPGLLVRWMNVLVGASADFSTSSKVSNRQTRDMHLTVHGKHEALGGEDRTRVRPRLQGMVHLAPTSWVLFRHGTMRQWCVDTRQKREGCRDAKMPAWLLACVVATVSDSEATFMELLETSWCWPQPSPCLSGHSMCVSGCRHLRAFPKNISSLRGMG
jgi:hypothetical protein